MKRIGLTQRVEVEPTYKERRDCLDQNWARLLVQAGYLPVPLSNAVTEVDSYLDSLDLNGVILTGGNDIAQLPTAQNPAPERDRFEGALVTVCRERQVPLMGICRGMQFLNLYLGGRLEPVEGHVATRHTVTFKDTGTFEGQSMEVNSYHQYAIPKEAVGAGLVPTAYCEDGTVEAFQSAADPWHGLMWHPERELPFRDEEVALIQGIFGVETR